MVQIGSVALPGYRCRCGHEWLSRKANKVPRVCPKCKSPNWDIPRQYSRSQNRKAQKIYRLGELFSGGGGIGLGAKLASLTTDSEVISIDHSWANDYDPDSCETYKTNLINKLDTAVICEDVRNLDISSLDSIDGFTFGFPCNDFSIVGEQQGFDGEFGPLYTYGVRVLRRLQPKWFIAENVSGLSSANGGKAFTKILEDLKACGYQITPHLYEFEKYGVPQSRHRIVVVGIRSDMEISFKVPAPTHSKYISSRDAIENPPIDPETANNELTKQSRNVVERLKHILPGQNAFNARLPKELELNVKGARLSQIYKRLDPDKPSYTVTGSGGGGTHVYHWEENRALTNRERARLQTFPDDYVFIGGKESVRKQIGMAVPPLAAKTIIEAVMKTLHGVPYQDIPNNIDESGSRINK